MESSIQRGLQHVRLYAADLHSPVRKAIAPAEIKDGSELRPAFSQSAR
jgi:hypothetical protein